MTHSRRRCLDWWEELEAVGLGVLIGLAGFYLVRTWLRRSPMDARGTESASGA